jgi:hypothetical protein
LHVADLPDRLKFCYTKSTTMPDSALTQNIEIRSNGDNKLQREVSRSESFSISPVETFHHRPSWSESGSARMRRTTTGAFPKLLKPFKEQDIKILLLENVNQTGKDILSQQGYQVESLKSSLPEDQLIEKIRYSSHHSSRIQRTLPLNFPSFLVMSTSSVFVLKPSLLPASSPKPRT